MSNVPPPPPMEYQTPPTGGDPAGQVKGPAIFLVVVGAIGIVLQILGLLMNLLGIGLAAAGGGGGGGATGFAMMRGGIGAVLSVVEILVGVVIVVGAMKMQKLQNYNLAMAAAVIAMIPCVSPCCLIGLPAGIWAIVI